MPPSQNVSRSSALAWRLLILLAATCFLRPTLFGQEMSWIGLALIFLVLIWHVLDVNPNLVDVDQNHLKAMRGIWVLTGFQVVFWVYCLLVATLRGESNFEFVLKAVIGGVFTALAFCILLSNQNSNYYFFVKLAKFQALLGYSIAVTVLLLQFFDRQQLFITNIAVVGYEEFGGGNGDLLFPFSYYYGQLSDYGIDRFLGIYRETGIAQLFFVWSLVFLVYSKSALYWRLGALFGAVLCGSTTVAVSFAAVIFLNLIFSGKKSFAGIIIGCSLLVLMVAALLYAPGLGLEDKQQTHGASLDDRSSSLEFVWSVGGNLVFGNGIYYKKYLPIPVGINAISSVFLYGVIGLLIVLAWFFCVPIICPSIRRQYVVSTAPLLITALISQPLIDAPSALILLYCTAYFSSSTVISQ